jgi:4-amino-4-deoxy-L-arabinose transferase-like glycosyltransferase
VPVNGGARRALLLLAAAGLALFFWRLGDRDLWPPDEPRFAVVAREMRESGDFTVLSLNGRQYTDKPPLFFWAINLFALATGSVGEWSARLPSAVSGLLALFLVYRLGRGLYDGPTGVLAALVFATAFQIVTRARWASIDMTLNLFVLGAIVLLWEARGGLPGGGRGRVRAAWVLMGLGTLAKGPVALVLPILAVVPALLLRREPEAARRVFAPTGLLVYAAVVLLWFGPFMARLGPGQAWDIVMHQNVDRYLDAWNSRHGIGYYLWRFPAGFLPWSLFLPWGIAQALARDERPRREAAVFLLAWMTAILLFFSFSTGKRGVYVIPIYPAAAILVGRLLARGLEATPEGESARRRVRGPILAWAAFSALFAAAAPFLAARRDPTLAGPAAVPGLCFLAGAVGAAFLRARGRPPAAAGCLVGSCVLACVVMIGMFVPWVERHQNIRGFAGQVRPRLQEGAAFGTTKQKRDAWVFYTGRRSEILDTPEAVLEFLNRSGPLDLLIEESELRRIRDRLPADAEAIVRGRVGGQDYYLLRRAAPAAAAYPGGRSP